MRVVENVLELVGQTPMLRMRRLEQASGAGRSAEIWAKLEFLNPGGSIKDRAALGLVLDAERRGVLPPGGTIVEATAGNTGVGLARRWCGRLRRRVWLGRFGWRWSMRW